MGKTMAANEQDRQERRKSERIKLRSIAQRLGGSERREARLLILIDQINDRLSDWCGDRTRLALAHRILSPAPSPAGSPVDGF